MFQRCFFLSVFELGTNYCNFGTAKVNERATNQYLCIESLFNVPSSVLSGVVRPGTVDCSPYLGW